MFSSNQSLLARVAFPKDSRAFWYILYCNLDQDFEADMFGHDEIKCIKAENFLTRSGSFIATISNNTLRVSLDLCMNFFELCILQQTSE